MTMIYFCRQPYRFRVRWKPHGQCLCAAHTSGTNSSSTRAKHVYIRPQRPVYDVNGVPIYFNNNPNNQPRQDHYCSTNPDARDLNRPNNSSNFESRDRILRNGSTRVNAVYNYSKRKLKLNFSSADKNLFEEQVLDFFPLKTNDGLEKETKGVILSKSHHDLFLNSNTQCTTAQIHMKKDLHSTPSAYSSCHSANENEGQDLTIMDNKVETSDCDYSSVLE